MLPNEYEKVIKKKRMSKCCSNGAVHTQEIKEQYDELQNPPGELNYLISVEKDKNSKDQHFLNNTMTLNSTYAFASIKGDKQDESVGGVCKYNGDYSFLFRDLFASNG